MLKPISPASPRKPRHTLDRLLDRALGPRPPPAPLALLPDELSTRAVRASGQDQDLYGDGGGPTREPATPFYSPVEPDFPISLHDVSLDSVWEEVQSAKARALVGAPSKVRSLEGAGSLGGQTAVQALDDGGYGGREKDAGGRRRRVTRRRSSVSFRESADGRSMHVTFEMAGVKKQDMHVSFRASRLIVSWQVEKTAEREDGDGALVREREVQRYSHTIPLPEGTKFEEVRASRDGQRLTLTVPNSRCVRVEGDDDEGLPSPRLIPDIDAAMSGVSEYHTCVRG